MTKLRAPLLGLSASGNIGDDITFGRTRGVNIVRTLPKPPDRKTLEQMYQRWDYQDYIYLWHQLSAAEKFQWESTARPHHMTGFAFWMSSRLTNLPNLAARYHLDQVSGVLVMDSSRNTNNGTVYGAFTVPGYISGALSFDGIDDYVDCGNNDSLSPTSSVTVLVWINPTTQPSGYGHINSKGNDNCYQTRIHTIGSTYRFEGLIKNSLGITVHLDEGPYQPLGTFHHHAFVYNGTLIALYKDGILKNTISQTGLIETNAQNLLIGKRIDGYFYANIIDQLSIYNRALSPEEIRTHANRRYP